MWAGISVRTVGLCWSEERWDMSMCAAVHMKATWLSPALIYVFDNNNPEMLSTSTKSCWRMTTKGQLSVWRWKDVLRADFLFRSFDKYFLVFVLFVRLVVLHHIYQRLVLKQNVKWSQFSISDRLPASSCEKTAVCFTASAMTYQQTYFRWLVLLSVIQWLEKTCSSCTISYISLTYFTLKLLKPFSGWVSNFKGLEEINAIAALMPLLLYNVSNSLNMN